MDHDTSGATAGLFGAFIMIYLAFIVAIIAVFIWCYWRIFPKAGVSGALALLNLIPGIGQLVCILILAFGTWPIEQAAFGGGGYRPQAPPSVGGPGSGIMQ